MAMILKDFSAVNTDDKILNLKTENSTEFKSLKKGIPDAYLTRQKKK